jgi:hypothetical protein
VDVVLLVVAIGIVVLGMVSFGISLRLRQRAGDAALLP